MLNIRINLKSKRDFMSKPGLDCKNLQGQVHQEVKININSSAHTQVSIKTGKNEGSKSDKDKTCRTELNLRMMVKLIPPCRKETKSGNETTTQRVRLHFLNP